MCDGTGSKPRPIFRCLDLGHVDWGVLCMCCACVLCCVVFVCRVSCVVGVGVGVYVFLFLVCRRASSCLLVLVGI